MAFDSAQVFYINPNLVDLAPEIGITAIDLFFRQVPAPLNNQSGISYPGVSVAIVPTIAGTPYLSNISMAPFARLEYTDILASTDASLASTFRFSSPVQVATGAEYAMVIFFDGDDNFVLWESTTGDALLGSNLPSPGSTDGNVGSFYNYIGPLPLASLGASSNSGMTLGSNSSSNTNLTANTVYTLNNWTPVSATELKFRVYVARYAVDGDYDLANHISNTNFPPQAQIYDTGNTSANGDSGIVSYTIPAQRMEYFTYDRPTSGVAGILVGEKVYQNTVFWPGGSATPAQVSVVANSNLITAVSNNINWTTLLAVGGLTPEYIVLQSLNGLGANADIVNVRQAVSVISNTVLQLDVPATFTNTGCYFFRTPVALVDQFLYGIRLFGQEEDLVLLRGSTANASVRFANDTIQGVTIASGGSGYSNTDYVTWAQFEYVSGKVLGGYSAKANLVTNTSGGITAVYMSNVGCGFGPGANTVYVISNSSGNTSVGSGANLVANVGMILKTEFLGQTGNSGYMQNCHAQSLAIGDFIPGLLLNNPGGTVYTASIRFPYYSVADATVSSGTAVYCDSDGSWDSTQIQPLLTQTSWNFTKRRVLPSWSQELVTPYGANGTSCNGAGGSSPGLPGPLISNSSVITVNAVSNNDFLAVAVALTDSTVTFFRYVINDDYTAENTNYGNAWAKGIESQFNLSNGNFAEDIVVYSTLYRPVGTDVKMFARVYNSLDPDAPDDKDWTMLELTGGINVYSSPTDPTDVIELTWGFQTYPNTGTPFGGSASSTLNSNVITGVGTSWSSNLTSNLTPNTLVVIYPALFPNNYTVSLVTSVANDTSFTISSPISNNDLAGPGLVVAPILYPHQAFNNWLNDNVVRYYNSSLSPYDMYDTAQFKIVMISGNVMMVPLISDIRGVAVSA